MFLQLIFSNPIIALTIFAVVIIALTVHEFSHALVGHAKGDPTAEQLGRLTLNPVKHIDPWGLVPFVLFGFGWARPVPFNPYNLKNPRVDALHIALAGPLSNLGLALVFAVAYRVLSEFGALSGLLPVFLVYGVLINLLLMIFNLIPIHPLDGSKILDVLLYKPEHQRTLMAIKQYGPQVLMFLVLLSIFSPINPFFFISVPAEVMCDGFLGTSCYGALLSF